MRERPNMKFQQQQQKNLFSSNHITYEIKKRIPYIQMTF